ncbi:MAG: MaoC family dehydratase [Xanthomonadales bacterium]|nr:MaoC family dehydratase [Xanthomonadales bacterium]
MQASELPTLAGRSLEPSSWLEITQERVNLFADATSDHQFIHTDPERAARTPFGGTIAHGFLTLALLPHLMAEKMPRPTSVTMGINYGSDKVRFIQPVRVGKRIRACQDILEVTQKSRAQWLLKVRVTVEIENVEKPALIAEYLILWIVR